MKPEIAQGTSIEIASADGSKPPEWVHLMPIGQWYGVNGQGPYRLDRPNAERIAASIKAAKRPLPIDYDHALDLAFGAKAGQQAPAAGWFNDAEARDDGIWVRVEWTERGGVAIASREYRYISPAFKPEPNTGRILHIVRAGLTNMPNFENLTALASQNQTEGTADMEEFLKQLIALLGLAVGATTDDVIAAIKDLQSKTTTVASQVAATAVALALPKDATLEQVAAAVIAKANTAGDATELGQLKTQVASLNQTVGNLNTELATMRTKAATNTAETVVASAIEQGKVAPAAKAWALDYATKDPAGFDAYLKAMPALLDPATGQPSLASQGEGGLSAIETEIASRMGLSPADYKTSKEQITKGVAV